MARTLHRARPVALAVAAALAGCAIPPVTVTPAGLRSPFTGYSSALYRDDAMWLCRPDLPHDVCHGDLTATEVLADGTRKVLRDSPPAPTKVDCFYVYPTVDLGLVPANHTDFDDIAAAEDAARSQLGLFRSACSLYVPLYRQATIGTYVLASEEGAERRAAVAYSDVEAAFLHYMGQYNHGRRVVLVGHSQGADMVVRLLQRRFEHDPLMRSRLLVAMPIGGPVEVPEGRLYGGTFGSIPLCSRPDEVGCVIAYQSRPATGHAKEPVVKPKPGNRTACVNPAPAGEHGVRRYSRSFFPITPKTRAFLHGVDDMTTPFVMVRDYFSAACQDSLDGYSYLAVAARPKAGDVRVSPLALDDALFDTALGLHVADFQFAMGDLIDLVTRKAAGAR